jgi:uncharacterized protein YutE (UPF0331/DUF86 family)
MSINGIVESKLRFLEQTMAELVRFRNFIVHRYEQIDPQIVYGLAKNKLSRFRDFTDEIRKGCAGQTPE